MKRFLTLCCLSLFLVSCSQENKLLLGSMSAEQRSLVRQAKEALIQLPDMPHRRNRNRELALLAEAALEAKEGALTSEIIDCIDNWRKEQLNVNLAVLYYKAQCPQVARALVGGVERTAQTVMDIKAGKVIAAGGAKDLLEQYDDFRLDRIKVALAAYCWQTGDRDAAKSWSEDVLPAEQAEFIKMQAESAAEEDYEASLIVNKILIEGETFEGKVAGLDGVVRLYELYFEDEEKRGDLAALMDEFSLSVPLMFRVEWLHRMAVAAFDHGDSALADETYAAASELIDDSGLRPRMLFPLKSSSIITAYKIGRLEEAQESTIQFYQEYRKIESGVYNMYRADVLCAVAEAFAYMNEVEQAEAVYLDALSQACENPNSRPRLEDLNLIVRSMIKYNVPLTPSLTSSIGQLINELGEPW